MLIIHLYTRWLRNCRTIASFYIIIVWVLYEYVCLYISIVQNRPVYMYQIQKMNRFVWILVYFSFLSENCVNSSCLPNAYYGIEYVQLNFSYCNDFYIADKFYKNLDLEDGKESYTANTQYGPRHIYSVWGEWWGISETMGSSGIDPRIYSSSTTLPLPERTETIHNSLLVYDSDWELWCGDSWVNNYMTLKKSNCHVCPEHSTSMAGSTDVLQCACKPGFSGQSGGVCTMCESGKYSVWHKFSRVQIFLSSKKQLFFFQLRLIMKWYVYEMNVDYEQWERRRFPTWEVFYEQGCLPKN